MRRTTILMLLAVLVALSPWSGLPASWLSFLLPVLAIAIASIAYTMRQQTPYIQPHLPPVHVEAEVKREPEPRASRVALS